MADETLLRPRGPLEQWFGLAPLGVRPYSISECRCARLDEVVAVTRHQEPTLFMSESQDCRIGALRRENIAEAHNLVAELVE
jgi:hypothetical protein